MHDHPVALVTTAPSACGSHVRQPAPPDVNCNRSSLVSVLVLLRRQGDPACGLRDDRRDGLRLRDIDRVATLHLDNR